MKWTIALSFFRDKHPVSCLRRSDNACPSGPTAMLTLDSDFADAQKFTYWAAGICGFRIFAPGFVLGGRI